MQLKLKLPKTLHKLLAEPARDDSISLNQYFVFAFEKQCLAEWIRFKNLGLSVK